MRNGNVTESIFNGKNAIIPMAEVQYIERDLRKGFEGGINVILSGTTWNQEIDHWNNNPYLSGEEAESFLRCWCTYRSELEQETLEPLPEPPKEGE